MKLTLLKMVQDILSDMNSDSVNSIYDTLEATQAAGIIRSTYYEMIGTGEWPHLARLFRIASSADNTRPTHMVIEDQIQEIHWVKYDIRRELTDPAKYRDIEWMSPKDFLAMTMERDASKATVTTVIDYNSTPLFVYNDRAPTYYTTFDDEHLVFDSYDATLDDCLQHSKTQAFGVAIPEWSMQNDYTPDLPAKAFPTFLAECKSVCFLRIKEVHDAKADAAAAKGRSWLARNKKRVGNGVVFPSYGRK